MENILYSEPYKSCSMMGALRIAVNFENAVCIINGPAGCSFFCRNTVLQINGYIHPLIKSKEINIYTTNFDENDVIFGANKKLIKIIEQIYNKKQPKMIFVFNCCVSEVIGEDLNEIEFELKDKIDSVIVPVRSAGFKGDHRVGMKLMNELIFDKLVKNQIRNQKKLSVNILGEMDVNYSTTRELTNILVDGGIDVVCRIPGKVGIDSIRNSVNAALNIIICGSASYVLAEKYKETYGIPYIKGSKMYSITGTFEVYKEIYDLFNLSTEKLILRRNKAWEEVEEFRKKLIGKKAFIIAGARRAIGYALVLKELGMEVAYMFSESTVGYTEPNTFKELANEVICDEWDDEIRKKIEEQRPSLVISTIPELTLPIRTISRVIDDFAGFDGTVKMAKYVTNILENKKGTVYWQTLDL